MSLPGAPRGEAPSPHTEPVSIARVGRRVGASGRSLLMWVPSGVLFSVLGQALFIAWIGDIEHRARRRREAS